MPRRLTAVALLACVAVAVAIVAGGGELNYDLAFALTWGQDVLAGRAPDFELALAPTAHPLTTGLGILAAPFSPQAGVLAMHWTAYLSLVAVLCSSSLWGASSRAGPQDSSPPSRSPSAPPS
jgi:hypothetical protein